MKIINISIFPSLNEESLKNLTAVVKETIAYGVIEPMVVGRKFKAIDLWKVQSNHKTASRRRNFA